MKTLLYLLILSFCIHTPLLQAEESGKKHHVEKNQEPFAEAVRMYGRKERRFQKMADREQDPAVKAKWLEMSKKMAALKEHKIKAGNAQKKGKGYDWSDYEKIQKEAAHLRQDINTHKKEHQPTHVKKEPVHKEGHAKPDRMKEKPGAEKMSEVKPEEKTFKTESGFKIRTKL